MACDEEFVREYWDAFVRNWDSDRPEMAVQSWSIWLPCNWTSRVGNTPHDEQMWAEAAAFTRERLEKIRQVEEELLVLEFDCQVSIDSAEKAIRRIQIREQAALAELKRGMK